MESASQYYLYPITKFRIIYSLEKYIRIPNYPNWWEFQAHCQEETFPHNYVLFKVCTALCQILGLLSGKDIDNGKVVTEAILKVCTMRKIDI